VFADQLPLWLESILFLPGGMTFPIMAFLLTEGYRHTRDVKRYGQRLLVFAVIALVPFRWAIGGWFNVLFTLLLGLIVIYYYDHMENRVMFWLLFGGAVVLSLFCDWSFIGVPMILIYHAVKDEKLRVALPILLPWLYYLPSLMAAVQLNGFEGFTVFLPAWCFVYVGCTASIFLLRRYNGERGPAIKWTFYAYYPAHLLVLALLYGLLIGDWRLQLLFLA
jgi:hypothetical protein